MESTPKKKKRKSSSKSGKTKMSSGKKDKKKKKSKRKSKKGDIQAEGEVFTPPDVKDPDPPNKSQELDALEKGGQSISNNSKVYDDKSVPEEVDLSGEKSSSSSEEEDE